ncbi:MAG: 30S ribosome-binding factor RbfA [Christensenellales bacterium]
MKSGRIEKINAELQVEIANIIKNELKDPRISGIISVLRVETDNDLYMANTYISIYKSNDEKATLKALQNSSGYVRKLLSKRIQLRTIPIINFKLDKTMDYSENINSILEKLDIPNDDE